MTDYRCVFSTTDRHRKFNQLRWQNMSAHLTNETSYWLKTFLMHFNWAIYNVCDLNIDPHVCFFPTLSQDRARPILFAQPEPVHSAARSLYALVHHTEVETATQSVYALLPCWTRWHNYISLTLLWWVFAVWHLYVRLAAFEGNVLSYNDAHTSMAQCKSTVTPVR